MTTRPLTPGETALARSVFGNAIDYAPVTVRHRKWFPFQPRDTVMAPCGHIHVHPHSELYSEDYSAEPFVRQGLFIHEMTHIWQAQHRGRFYLPLMRHPFCRYRYDLRPEWTFDRYGLEQQAEIVRHYFLRRISYPLANTPSLAALEAILPFPCRQPEPPLPAPDARRPYS
jgi:hypothetical protein